MWKLLQSTMLHLLAHRKKRVLLPASRSLKCQLKYRSWRGVLVALLTMAAKTAAQILTVDRAGKMEMLRDLLGPFSDDCLSALRVNMLSII